MSTELLCDVSFILDHKDVSKFMQSLLYDVDELPVALETCPSLHYTHAYM